MPAASEPSRRELPHTWRPFGVRIAGAVFGTLLLVVTVGSFGIAGVGGGATFAAIVALSAMNLPVALAGLLISIEPLIDMGRTAVNVTGQALVPAVVAKRAGIIDPAAFEGEPRSLDDDPAESGSGTVADTTGSESSGSTIAAAGSAPDAGREASQSNESGDRSRAGVSSPR